MLDESLYPTLEQCKALDRHLNRMYVDVLIEDHRLICYSRGIVAYWTNNNSSNNTFTLVERPMTQIRMDSTNEIYPAYPVRILKEILEYECLSMVDDMIIQLDNGMWEIFDIGDDGVKHSLGDDFPTEAQALAALILVQTY